MFNKINEELKFEEIQTLKTKLNIQIKNKEDLKEEEIKKIFEFLKERKEEYGLKTDKLKLDKLEDLYINLLKSNIKEELQIPLSAYLIKPVGLFNLHTNLTCLGNKKGFHLELLEEYISTYYQHSKNVFEVNEENMDVLTEYLVQDLKTLIKLL